MPFYEVAILERRWVIYARIEADSAEEALDAVAEGEYDEDGDFNEVAQNERIEVREYKPGNDACEAEPTYVWESTEPRPGR